MYLLNGLLIENRQTLIVGNTGTGKTLLVKQALAGLSDEYAGLELNFSAATTAAITQDIIEGSMEKRAKGKYGPPGGKVRGVRSGGEARSED